VPREVSGYNSLANAIRHDDYRVVVEAVAEIWTKKERTIFVVSGYARGE
jgi:hypothetical protein